MSNYAVKIRDFFNILIKNSDLNLYWIKQPQFVSFAPQFPYLGYYNPLFTPYISLFDDQILKFLNLHHLECMPISILCNTSKELDYLPSQGILKTSHNVEALSELLYPLVHENFAKKTYLHGTFINVHQTGVLLIGKSGVGKSQIALQLINKGHQLIADDAPEIFKVDFKTLYGTCPATIENLLEVKGMGICNIKEIYGINSVKKRHQLNLIIEISRDNPSSALQLRPTYQKYNILGVTLPYIKLNISRHDNIANLVEIATLTYHSPDKFLKINEQKTTI